MKKIWDTISSKTVLSTKWLKIKHDRYILPNKKEGDYFFIATFGSSVIVPITDEGEIVLIKQYRYLTKRISIEFPMGGIEDGQTPLQAAKAELEQESGYQAKKFTKIGDFNPFIGVTDEICNVYIAEKLTKTKQCEDDTEKIDVLIHTPSEVRQLITKGKIWDGQSIAAWYFAEKYLKIK